MELVLKYTESELSHAVCKLATKVGNLGPKIDMQYARWAKLGRMIGKLPKLESKLVFWNRKAEMLSINSLK